MLTKPLCHTARMETKFSQLLRQWRHKRRYSQLQLSLELEVSARHLSFLETGRSQPSRDMILKIALFLGAPKGEINQALLAAGFSPAYSANSEESTDLKPALDAIEFMLTKQLPYPALVFNSDWDIVNLNSSAQDLMSHSHYQGNNFLEFLMHDQLKEKLILNWSETAAYTLQRIHQESLIKSISPKLAQLEQQLTAQLASSTEYKTTNKSPIILSTQLNINNQTLSFFSVLAQLSSVQDLIISEYHIELMFPADHTTTSFYQSH